MRFRNEYWFLSNFYPAQVWSFPSAEHAFVAEKTNVESEREYIRTLPTPQAAKAYGRRLTMRPEWADPKVRLASMREVVWFKFLNHADLREKLVATGNLPLVEDNWWGDTFWGMCDGVGENHLGRILMETRKAMTCAHCNKAFQPFEYDIERWTHICEACEALVERGYVDDNPSHTEEFERFQIELDNPEHPES